MYILPQEELPECDFDTHYLLGVLFARSRFKADKKNSAQQEFK